MLRHLLALSLIAPGSMAAEFEPLAFFGEIDAITGERINSVFDAIINENGDVFFVVGYGASQSNITGRGFYLATADGERHLLARTGQTLFDNCQLQGVSYPDYGFNNQGEVALIASTAGPECPSEALVVLSVNGSEVRIKTGDPVIGTETLVELFGLPPTVDNPFSGKALVDINDAGAVLFSSYLAGPGITTANDSVLLLLDSNGELQVIAQEGDPVPNAPFIYEELINIFLLGSLNNNSSALIETALEATTVSQDLVIGILEWSPAMGVTVALTISDDPANTNADTDLLHTLQDYHDDNSVYFSTFSLSDLSPNFSQWGGTPLAINEIIPADYPAPGLDFAADAVIDNKTNGNADMVLIYSSTQDASQKALYFNNAAAPSTSVQLLETDDPFLFSYDNTIKYLGRVDVAEGAFINSARQAAFVATYRSRLGGAEGIGAFRVDLLTIDRDDDQAPDVIEFDLGLDATQKDNDVFANSLLFVRQMYRDFLRREGDEGGINFWQGQIDGGFQTYADMGLTFLLSQEFLSQVEARYPELTETSEIQVTALYEGMLQRAPDQAGFEFWVANFESGVPVQTLVQLFLDSPEYRLRFLPPE